VVDLLGQLAASVHRAYRLLEQHPPTQHQPFFAVVDLNAPATVGISTAAPVALPLVLEVVVFAAPPSFRVSEIRAPWFQARPMRAHARLPVGGRFGRGAGPRGTPEVAAWTHTAFLRTRTTGLRRSVARSPSLPQYQGYGGCSFNLHKRCFRAVRCSLTVSDSLPLRDTARAMSQLEREHEAQQLLEGKVAELRRMSYPELQSLPGFVPKVSMIDRLRGRLRGAVIVDGDPREVEEIDGRLGNPYHVVTSPHLQEDGRIHVATLVVDVGFFEADLPILRADLLFSPDGSVERTLLHSDDEE
jgi:hypothetical protein